MKIPTKVTQILDRLESNGFEAFVVGGCVRDSILGISPADWDVCTSAFPEDVQAVFSDFFVIPTGLKHGTVTVILDNMQVEITTYRRDGMYLDHRHPDSVCFTSNIQEDLKRRDFTINAMAYSPRKGLVDFFEGVNHLKKKILCCVGNPQKRFSEDALRILRGIRFAARFGLTIEPETSQAIHDCKDGIHSISAERILVELIKILESPNLSFVLSDYPDVLATIFPNIKNSFTVSASWNEIIEKLSLLPSSFPLRISALLDWCYRNGNQQELLDDAIKKLKPDNKTRHHISRLLECLQHKVPEGLIDARKFIGKYGLTILEEILVINEVLYDYKANNIKRIIKEIQEKKLCCTLDQLAISGHDLKMKGLSGTNIGLFLHQALDAVTEGRVANTKESLLNFLFS